ncbi:MAG: DsrE family protein [Gemmatimonadaceae bacterium]
MKRIIFVASIALLSVGFASRSPQPYHVAFDLTSRDTLEQKLVLRWVNEVTTADPNAEVEVVMYAKGFELVMPERSNFNAEVQAAVKNPKVAFKVCAVAMRNNQIEKSQLAVGVQVVPDGIRELVSKQQENWGYIKVAH